MILKRNRRIVPQLNTTSTADISFILLVFFLVMTSMDVDKGLQRQLPPAENKPQQEITDVSKNNLMELKLTAGNILMIDGKPMEVGQLCRRVAAFVSRKDNRQSHVIALSVDRRASYDAYFNVQNEIMAAYNSLRNRYAISLYGKSYAHCSTEQREKVREYYPLRIAEIIEEQQEGGAK